MAGSRRGQSDITLGAGHVVGIFLGIVVLCGIFFTLGYVMGRGRPSAKSSAGSATSPAVDAGGNPATGPSASTGWDFFPKKSSRPGTPTPGLTSPSSAAPAANPSSPISMTPPRTGSHIERKPPVLSRGRKGLFLQVAAMANRADALALAGFLKKKRFPAFVWGPASDHLYRVQVGPYPDAKAARKEKKKLEKEGFLSILKRE